MKESIKQNLIVVLAFALPIAIILVAALSVYLPSLFVSTKYNFVYSSCLGNRDYYPYLCDNYLDRSYSVVDGKIVVNPIDPKQDLDGNGTPDIKQNISSRLFIHDTQKNESREITLEEAQTLVLNNLITSPDGVTVSRKNPSRETLFFIFSGSQPNNYYLTKGKGMSKLNLLNLNNQYNYRDNFQFIGWILPR